MGKLQINGDLLLAGNLMMSTSNISAYSVISVKPDSSAYGQNLIIGAGGNTVIGGGESASAFFTASGIKDEENLYLTADGSVHVYTNCDSIANRKLVMSMEADGNITTTGTIITPGNDSVVIKPAKHNYDQIGASDCRFWKVHAGTFYGNLSGNADTASLLSIHNTIINTSTRSTSASSWNGSVSGLQYVWGQSFKDTSISSDTGDLVLGLRAGQYTSGSTELCMMIDGDYYALGNKVLHAGNYNSYAPTKTGGGASGTWGINITGNAGYASSAGTVTYQSNVSWYAPGTGNTAGWYRIYQFGMSNASSPSAIIHLSRSYNSPENEGYIFAITVGYNGHVQITQLSGYTGGHLVSKIRVDYTNSGNAYVDFYMGNQSYNNQFVFYGSGYGNFVTPYKVSSPSGSTYEFATVTGFKCDRQTITTRYGSSLPSSGYTGEIYYKT